MAEPISDETLALVRGKHGPTGPETSHGSLNVGIAPPCKCGYVWPCTIARMLARIDAAEARAVPELTAHERGTVESYRAHWPFGGDHPLVTILDRLVPLSPTDTPEEA